MRDDVHAAIQLLPEKQRLVTLLFYVEGYSQKEIAAFLEIPITSVKKRLVNARKNLKERMSHMVSETLQATKPSQNEQFANAVRFFTAVLDNDIETVKESIQRDATLLETKAEWKMAIKREFWTGAPALIQAVGYDYLEMVRTLIGLGADVNVRYWAEQTPLHVAAIMKRPELTRLLIDCGAKINAKSSGGQTPLHISAIRGDLTVGQLLLASGTDVDSKDNQKRRPIDWALLQQNQDFVDLLLSHGSTPSTIQAPHWTVSENSPILETNIKILDLLSPLKRGGIAGIFTAMSGVGFMVVISQIMRSIQKLHSGVVIMAGLDSDHSHEEHWRIFLREADADRNVAYHFGSVEMDTASQQQIAEQALNRAQLALEQEKSVLLVLNSNLAMTEGVLDQLRRACQDAPNTNLSVLIYGHHTVGVLPEPFKTLDTVVTFNMDRALSKLYPAIDPVRSYTTQFENGLQGTPHAQIAENVRHLLTRHADLRIGYERGGPETLWYIDDDPALHENLIRARRLERFLTQPLFGTEPWTGVVGEYVSLDETIRGCRAILNGEYDDVAEEALHFIGKIEAADSKAD